MIPKSTFFKSLLTTLIYYLLTSGISIILYLTLGKYLLNINIDYLSILDSMVYLIILIILISFRKRTNLEYWSDNNSLIFYLISIIIIAFTFRISVDPIYRFDLIFNSSDFPTNFSREVSLFKKFAVFLNIVLLAPIVEELVFRGIILNKIVKEYGIITSLLVSSLLFSLIHINFYPFSFNIISFLNAFFLGIITGLIFLKIGIKYSITLHFLINLIWYILNYFLSEEYWKALIHLEFNFLYWIIVTLGLAILLFPLSSINKKTK